MKGKFLTKGASALMGSLLLTAGLVAAPASAAVPLKAYVGVAYDVRSQVLAGTLESGPVAPAAINCRTTPNSNTNSASSVNIGGVSLGAVSTSAVGTFSSGIQTTTSTFQATGVNIGLGVGTGLTADAITMTTITTHDTADGSFTHSGTMTVANLAITASGSPLLTANGTVDPNTYVGIPGVADFLLNSREVIGDGTSAAGQIGSAIRFRLVGETATVGVGEVLSGLQTQLTEVLMGGSGIGVQANVDDVVSVGPLAVAGLPCYGTGGTEVSVVETGGPIAGLGSTGTITSTAQGSASGSSATGTTTSQTEGISLLSGVITADAIKAIASATTNDGAATVTPSTSTVLTNLSVLGLPISVNTPPNTVITLPGVGWVAVNVQIQNQPYANAQAIGLWVHLDATNTDLALSHAFVILVPGGGGALAKGSTPKATALMSGGKAKATAKSLKEANALLKKLSAGMGTSKKGSALPLNLDSLVASFK